MKFITLVSESTAEIPGDAIPVLLHSMSSAIASGMLLVSPLAANFS